MRVERYVVIGLLILLAMVAPATAITLTLENVYEKILKPAPVPASSIEVVYPDGKETIVIVHRDGTSLHGNDYNAYATVKMSRDGGHTWTYVATIDEPDFDDSRTGDCLIKINNTVLYFFSHGRYSNGSAYTIVYKLTWNNTTFSVEEFDRYHSTLIIPHWVENGVIKVSLWTNYESGGTITMSQWEVYFGEYDPATKTVVQKGLIKSGEAPNENTVVKLSDGIIAIVRLEQSDLGRKVFGWAVSNDGGDTWDWKGYIPEATSNNWGAPLGEGILLFPDGERIALLMYFDDGSGMKTRIGVFNPSTGSFDYLFNINTITGDEGANGGMRLVKTEISPSNITYTLYVVHEQGTEDSTASGHGIAFRIVKLIQSVAKPKISVSTTPVKICNTPFLNITIENLNELYDFEILIDSNGDGVPEMIVNELNITLPSSTLPIKYKVTVTVKDPFTGAYNETSVYIVIYSLRLYKGINMLSPDGRVIYAEIPEFAHVEIKPIKVTKEFTVIISEEDIYANETGKEILNMTIFGLAGGDKIWLNETVARARTVDLLHNGEPIMTAIPVVHNAVNTSLTSFSTYTLVVNNTAPPPEEETLPPEEVFGESWVWVVVIVVATTGAIVAIIYLSKKQRAVTRARIKSGFRFFKRL